MYYLNMKLKKIYKLIFFVQFLALSHIAKSQFFIGFEIGITQNHLNTYIKNRVFTNNKNGVGYSFGFPLQYRINSWLSINSNLNFSEKKYSWVRTGTFRGVYQIFANNYIQLPLLANMSYGNKKIQGFINAGGYVGYWMYGRVKGTVPDIFNITDSTNASGQTLQSFGLSTYNQKYTFNSNIDNRIEFGWVVGLGMNYKLANSYSFFTEIIYYQALTDQQKKYTINQIPQHNQTFIFSIGVLYSFK